MKYSWNSAKPNANKMKADNLYTKSVYVLSLKHAVVQT